MGGSIFVGVRTRDGVEHLGISWTNWLPRLFADPTFYSEGAALKELLDYWKEEQGRAEVRKKIAPSEYGVVLVDLKTGISEEPQLWHSNGYSDFGNLLYSIGFSNEPLCDELALRLLSEKLYSRVDWDYFRHVGKVQATDEQIELYKLGISKYLNAIERGADMFAARPADLGAIVIYTNFVDVTRVQENERNRGTKMCEWVRARGWTSPCNKTWRRS